MQMKCKLITYAIRENEACFKSWTKKESANLVPNPECELMLIILIKSVLTHKFYTCNMQHYATASAINFKCDAELCNMESSKGILLLPLSSSSLSSAKLHFFIHSLP
jgi:hypothetical protein